MWKIAEYLSVVICGHQTSSDMGKDPSPVDVKLSNRTLIVMLSSGPLSTPRLVEVSLSWVGVSSGFLNRRSCVCTRMVQRYRWDVAAEPGAHGFREGSCSHVGRAWWDLQLSEITLQNQDHFSFIQERGEKFKHLTCKLIESNGSRLFFSPKKCQRLSQPLIKEKRHEQ